MQKIGLENQSKIEKKIVIKRKYNDSSELRKEYEKRGL